METNQRNAIIGIAIIGLAVLAGYYYTISCRQDLSGQELTCSTAQKVLPYVDAVPILIFASLVGGALAFYLVMPKGQAGDSSKPAKFNSATLKFLQGDERAIVKRLVEKGGEAMQSELTHIDGMTKIRSHRAIRKLEQKEVVRVVPKGKTNLVKLTGDLI